MELEAIIKEMRCNGRIEIPYIIKEMEDNETTLEIAEYARNNKDQPGVNNCIRAAGAVSKIGGDVANAYRVMKRYEGMPEYNDVCRAVTKSARNSEILEKVVGFFDRYKDSDAHAWYQSRENEEIIGQLAEVMYSAFSPRVDLVDFFERNIDQGLKLVESGNLIAKYGSFVDGMIPIIEENIEKDNWSVYMNTIDKCIGFTNNADTIREIFDVKNKASLLSIRQYVEKFGFEANINKIIEFYSEEREEAIHDAMWNIMMKTSDVNAVDKAIDWFKDGGNMPKVISNFASYSNDGETVIKVIDLMAQYKDHKDNVQVLATTAKISALVKDAEQIKKICSLFEMYVDNNPGEVASALEEAKHVYIDGLFSQKVYNEIKKDPLMAKKLVRHDYSFLDRMDIDVSYELLDLVRVSKDFVLDIHRNRNRKQKAKILDEFFSEMNRAVNQSHDYQEQVFNLRVYCNEVIGLMIDNAEDLMVVTNG